MNIYVDTCVLPRGQLQTGRIYRERFGSSLGFELLMMFDLPDFEENLRQNLSLFADGPLIFHEPVWGVEHTEPRGSAAWEEGQHHLRLTKEYAEILRPPMMVYHLNNCSVKPEEKDRKLRISLENLEEMRQMFPDVKILTENTGTRADGTMMLDQAEFTDLCRGRKLPVLIDIGHAHANGWDIRKLIRDLQDQICGYHLHNNDGIHDLHNRLTDGRIEFRELIPYISRMTPDVPMVIEYSRPAFHGEPLMEDIETLRIFSVSVPAAESAETHEKNETADLTHDQMNYILRCMNEAVCLTGPDGKLLYANRAAEKLFGIHAGEQQRIWDAIPFEAGNDALIQLFIDGVAEKRGAQRSMVDYVNKDGDVFHLYVNLVCDEGESSPILIVINDLTHLINAHSAFARYTSPEIANFVLTAPEGGKQGGQEREASILMSDLRGFTAMSTRLASTDLIDLLNHYFEHMSAVIRRFGGTVIEFLGDGIFVVFGAPEDLPEHASAAVSCAIEMQNAMAEVNAWNREHHYPELAMGIGISSGKVVVGNIGSERKMKYGCMGETVNLAGRMEAFSVGGQIHISEDTKKMIPEELTVLGENTFMPKGGRKEMKIYNISGIGKNRRLQNTGEVTGWKALSGETGVLIFKLDGKIVGRTSHSGQLTHLSEDGKQGILTTDEPLTPLQDLMIRIDGQDIYAKVTDCRDDGCRISFTMMDENAAGRLARRRQENA